MEEIVSYILPKDQQDSDGVYIPPEVATDILEGKATTEWTETSLKIDYGNGEFYIYPRFSQIFLMAASAMRK